MLPGSVTRQLLMQVPVGVCVLNARARPGHMLVARPAVCSSSEALLWYSYMWGGGPGIGYSYPCPQQPRHPWVPWPTLDPRSATGDPLGGQCISHLGRLGRIFKKFFFILFAKNMKKEVEIPSHPLVHSADACNVQGWARMKPVTQNSIQGPPGGGRGSVLGPSAAACQGAQQQGAECEAEELWLRLQSGL